MKLIIAEKKSVAKSIASALGVTSGADGFYEGSGWIVSWCVGHLVSPMDAASYDQRFKKWRYEDLPIVPEPFRYVLIPGKEDTYRNLRSLMNRPDVEGIVNACDAGREGELIFRLVYCMTGCSKPVERLWISSMEDSSIREGFQNLRPSSDYDALYHSALCRQKADWLVGINATRLFSVLYHRTLNVGRVQTPTLALLAEREEKIQSFQKEKYHHVRLQVGGAEAVSERFEKLSQAQAVLVSCSDRPATCTSVTREQKKEQPPKLYDLTTLQREANRILDYTAKQTLDYAQSLYEKKLLTYPRTDSRYLTSDMAETASVIVHLAARIAPFDGCASFFPDVLSLISDKDVSDHHAIIPTMAELINLTSNLDCYEFQPNITDYEDLGKWDLYERSEFTRSVVEALEDYIDFESYGHDVARGEGGKLAEYCYVFPSGSEFYEEYNGDPDTIPDEYVVYTPDLLNLDPEEKLAWAIPLAISLDSFFRENDSGYAAQYPDIPAQQEVLCDSLIDGKIAAIDKRLSDMGQTEKDALPSELADFKRLSGYYPEMEKQSETMKVLVVAPRQPPCVKEIPSGLEGVTDVVGGPISATYPFRDPVALICNDEGRNMGLELNRALYNGMGQVYDVIPGTFVIAGLTDDSFTSLPEDMIEKYSRRFQTIEVYAQVGNRTVMFQVPQDTMELSDQCWDSVIRDKLGQKPSIRESLAAAKEECAVKPSPERIHKRSEHEL